MADEKKRATVNVRNSSGRSLMLHLHKTVPDDGGGRSFQGRVLSGSPNGMPAVVQLKGGANSGIDKEFFETWREQNKGSGLLDLLTAEDEGEPESAKREEHD